MDPELHKRWLSIRILVREQTYREPIANTEDLEVNGDTRDASIGNGCVLFKEISKTMGSIITFT